MQRATIGKHTLTERSAPRNKRAYQIEPKKCFYKGVSNSAKKSAFTNADDFIRQAFPRPAQVISEISRKLRGRLTLVASNTNQECQLLCHLKVIRSIIKQRWQWSIAPMTSKLILASQAYLWHRTRRFGDKVPSNLLFLASWHNQSNEGVHYKRATDY